MEKLPDQVNQQLSIFGLPSASLAIQIEHIRDQFTPYYQLWNAVYAFQTTSAQWLHGPFAVVDAEGVERSVGLWLAITKYGFYFLIKFLLFLFLPRSLHVLSTRILFV
jgi:hypothetical protein